MVDKIFKNDLFRLAAVLYADNNYEISSKNVVRKIIESIFLDNNNGACTINELIESAFNSYDIQLEEDEINRVIIDSKYSHYFDVKYSEENCIRLSEQRIQNLRNKIYNRTIDYFIDEYVKNIPFIKGELNPKDLLYKFLYEVFSNNIESLRKLMNSSYQLTNLVELNSEPYTDQEKEIINNFLSWDNDEKNIAIFNIVSYALEYYMLTNKRNNIVQVRSIKNKIFYLDTNIIYRALGINGENRKKRAETLLAKFQEVGEKLIISKTTDKEFKESIHYNVKLISKYDTPAINSKLFIEYNDYNRDIYNYYYSWKIGRINSNLDVFEAYIISQYDSWAKNNHVEIDNIVPYDPENEQDQNIINKYAQSILTHKQNDRNTYVGSSFYDAENLYWIEKKRGANNQNLLETKFYLISTDQSLRKWDFFRKDCYPIVMLPSQWLSILLRYTNRTNDDYKSFVSFLNLSSGELILSSEKLQIVMAGISQMASDIETQGTLVKNLVEKKFKGIIEKGIDDEEIFNRVQKYAKTELEKEVERLRNDSSDLKNQIAEVNSELENQKKQLKEVASTHEKEKNEIELENSGKTREIQELKNELFQKYISTQIRKWRLGSIPFVVVSVLIILFFFFEIFYSDLEYNYVNKLISWIDNNVSETKKETLRLVINGGLISALQWGIRVCVARLFSKRKYEIEIEKIKENVPEKYK
ncbi:hypothetical protein [uncultured Culturomica sp.]|uniref:hypothetical protein n=1 Tax=uncultured Culturomica sp. TaxID=1926654 RepID=UPI00259870EF|nr:hypothetical protein [uncultured Culturomica sp.]